MSEGAWQAMRISGLLIAAAGLLLVYLAPKIVSKRQLADKVQLSSDLFQELSEDEVKKVRRDRAILNLKLKGLLLASPGLILILIGFSR